LGLPTDTNAPGDRTLLEIIPGELTRTSRFKLAAERSGVMIGDQDKTFARFERLKGAENERAALRPVAEGDRRSRLSTTRWRRSSISERSPSP